MGRITSTVGLASGVPIKDTVDQLMALAARPRDLVASRNQALGQQQAALGELTAKVLAVQFQARQLAKETLFNQVKVSSSDPAALSAVVTGEPAVGNYQFTPARVAASQQLLSTAFSADDQPLGAGSFSFQFGGEVDEDVNLGLINGGEGIQRGKIRITDRSGASAEIDLRFARTADDVIKAVNDAAGVNVRLEASGDAFRLVDLTGQSVTNLKVQEVSGGRTATDLGLAGIDGSSAATAVAGADVLRLFGGLSLDLLNDGRGIRTKDALPDLQVTFRDGGTPLLIDFDRLPRAEGNAKGTTNAVNGADAKLRFTAAATGEAFDDFQITFVDDAGVTAGSEVVEYDENARTLNFRIDEGSTDADHIIAALAGHAEAGAAFTAVRTTANPAGLISSDDTAITSGGAALEERHEQTLADILDTINEAGQGRLLAEIGPDGDRLVITDLTADLGGTFAITSQFDSKALDDLGLNVTAQGGVLTGGRLHAGLKTTLVRSLGGGAGLGNLGTLDITDRAGTNVSIDLTAAPELETLEQIIDYINGEAATAGVQITARINDAKNGLAVIDTSGGAGNLSISSADETAAALGIAVDAATSNFQGTTLKRQTVSENTRLETLNGGRGVAPGRFSIVDTDGKSSEIDLGLIEAETIGDVIDAINDGPNGVVARINDAGDGILLYDIAEGSQALKVLDLSGTAAADLHLLGDPVDQDINGEIRPTIDGSTKLRIDLDADDTIDDLIEKINDAGAGLTALKLGDGSVGNPFRLSLLGQRTGDAANLVFDTSGVGFSLQQTAAAQDALLEFGGSGNGDGVLIASDDSRFEEIVPGLRLEVRAATQAPVTVGVTSTDEKLVSAAQLFVNTYNDLRAKLKELTFFNEDDSSTGVLFGSNETLRIDTELSHLLTGRFFGVGDIQSLETVGISIKDDGTLAFDSAKLKAEFAEDPTAVREFFTNEDLGVAAKFDRLIETMAGRDNSLLVNRIGSLASKIETNNERIELLNVRLEAQRERLLLSFFRMEEAIAKLQNDLTALNSIQILAPLSFRE